MSERHTLSRDIETLREVINRDWTELALADLTRDEAMRTLQHLQDCNRILKGLVERRDDLTEESRQVRA